MTTDLRGKRLLITGGAGYIGSHTLLALLNCGAEPLVIDNFSNSTPLALERIAALAGRDFPHIALDLRDGEALRDVMQTFRPEAIVHFAGAKAVEESVRMPLFYYDNNVNASIRLLEAMDAVGCDRILFSSSATVYGQAQYLPFDEAHPVSPTNPYGRTKAITEDILRDWVAVSPSRAAISLRYFNPVGAHASGRIGEDPRGIPNNLMPYVARVAAGILQEIAVFGNDFDTRDGSGERDYIHVDDLATGHVAALRHLSKAQGYDLFNLGTGRGVTVLELISAFSRSAGRQLPYRITGRRPGDTAVSIADVGRAERVLEWKARHDLQSACDSAWRWQNSNPHGYVQG